MGRPFTLLDGIDEPTRDRLYEAVISDRREKFTDIYRRFGLEQRNVKLDSFMKWARKERREYRSKQVADSLPSLPPPSGAFGRSHALFTLERSVQAANALMDAGDFKSASVLSSLMRAQMDYLRLTLDESAEKRAQELHDKKLERLEPAVKDAIASSETQGSKDLRGILEQVSTGGMAIDAALASISDCIWVEIDKHMRGAA